MEWVFAVRGEMQRWDWATGGPPLPELRSVRRPTSRSDARHVPVRAYSTTTRAHLYLESGLEHDLVRVLDRDPETVHLVAQPAVLRWPVERRRARAHVPDLLSMRADGSVTIWDVRPHAKTDYGTFAEDVTVTRDACEAVGWDFEVFTGLIDVHRHNLLWLNAYRQEPAWASEHRIDVLDSVGEGCTLGELMGGADPERRAVVWHMVWSGDLQVDLAQRLVPSTAVTL